MNLSFFNHETHEQFKIILQIFENNKDDLGNISYEVILFLLVQILKNREKNKYRAGIGSFPALLLFLSVETQSGISASAIGGDGSAPRPCDFSRKSSKAFDALRGCNRFL